MRESGARTGLVTGTGLTFIHAVLLPQEVWRLALVPERGNKFNYTQAENTQQELLLGEKRVGSDRFGLKPDFLTGSISI